MLCSYQVPDLKFSSTEVRLSIANKLRRFEYISFSECLLTEWVQYELNLKTKLNEPFEVDTTTRALGSIWTIASDYFWDQFKVFTVGFDWDWKIQLKLKAVPTAYGMFDAVIVRLRLITWTLEINKLGGRQHVQLNNLGNNLKW